MCGHSVRRTSRSSTSLPPTPGQPPFAALLPVSCTRPSIFSAIVEHTRQVIFLEDDDVAFVENGSLSIHRIKRDGTEQPTQQQREVHQLTMELQQIMRGDYKTFMQ